MILDEKTLEEIIRESNYKHLTKEELKPYFNMPKEILDEVKVQVLDANNFDTESFEEFLDEDTIKYPERREWYKLMLEAFTEHYSPVRHFRSNLFAPLGNHEEYNLKRQEERQVLYEIDILEKQRKEIEKTFISYIQLKEVSW